MKSEKEIKVKRVKITAHIDCLKDNFTEKLYDLILDSIPYEAEDDVFEFELLIKNIKDITEKVGIDEEGCRAFYGVEIDELEIEPRYSIKELEKIEKYIIQGRNKDFLKFNENATWRASDFEKFDLLRFVEENPEKVKEILEGKE